MGKILLLNILLLSLPFVSNGMAQERPTVFVSILPQKYFVQQISGDKIRVEVMVKPGASPATYEPKPSQMKMLAKSDIYFSIGVPFENSWLPKLAGVNRDMKIVHTDDGIEKIMMAQHGHDEHDVKEEHGHDHGESGQDPHIWLSPSLVKKQAATIMESLTDHYPQWASFFNENYTEFQKEIDRLDTDVRAAMEGRDGMEFMVFHPSWGYFARDYNLRQVPIEVEGKEPKPSQLQDLIEHAKEHGISIVFAQPQFSKQSAGVIAREINGEVLLIDPLAENWSVNLREVAATIKNNGEKK